MYSNTRVQPRSATPYLTIDYERLIYIASLYDMLARTYVELYGTESFRKYCLVIEFLQQLLASKPISNRVLTLLDAGSGVGIGLTYLSSMRLPVHAIGVDISRESCKVAYGSMTRNMTDIVVAAIEMLPFRDKRFDIVLAVSSLDLDVKVNLKLQLNELKRVSRGVNLYVPPGQEVTLWVERKR